MPKKQYKRIQLADSSPEWNISECGSSDEDRWTSGRQRVPESPLYIEICSSDEENDRHFDSLLHNTSASTPHFGQRKTPHTQRKKLPLSIARRKRNHAAADERPNVRRVLTNRNSDLEESPSKSSNHALSPWTPTSANEGKPEKSVTPWRKLCKVFAPLRRETKNILETAQCNDNNAKATHASEDLNEMQIVWSSSSSSSCSEAGSPARTAKSVCSKSANTQQSTAPTELELLVALIERECNSTKQPGNARPKEKQRNRFKNCRKDGYAAQLKRALASAHADQMFLTHDQQLGLQHGAQLRVLRLDTTFGVHFATVQLEGVAAEQEGADRFRVVVAANMARQLQIGSKIMAFFDVNVEPYEVQGERIYVQPHKLCCCK